MEPEVLLPILHVVKQAGGKVVGISSAIEKTYQGGYDKLTALGYDVYSLARIKEMVDGKITFI